MLPDFTQAVHNEISLTKELAALGAKDFVILNVPDLGKTPSESGGFFSSAATLSALYDGDLKTDLQTLAAADYLSIHLVDTYTLIEAAVADPAAYTALRSAV